MLFSYCLPPTYKTMKNKVVVNFIVMEQSVIILEERSESIVQTGKLWSRLWVLKACGPYAALGYMSSPQCSLQVGKFGGGAINTAIPFPLPNYQLQL